MRKKIVAGNWKMNNDFGETKELIKKIRKYIKKLPLENVRVMIAPTFVNLPVAIKKSKNSRIEVIAQNMHQEKNGAFTGEVSSSMLKSIGIETVILGHSERRTYFGETDQLLIEKVNIAMESNMEIVFCFGESLEDRKSGNHFSVVENQIRNVLFHLNPSAWKSIILAYEPVWAIGTGETATPEQAQEMHAFVRGSIKKQYSKELSENISILYGGSVKPTNASEIFLKPDVDGGLIGGAALKVIDFTEILEAII